ncbi:MAG: hypothetical protein ABSD42_06855 [Candidatus Bathyarchaeia archaeon]
MTTQNQTKMPCGDYYENRKIGSQPCDGMYAGQPFKLRSFCRKCPRWSGYEVDF